MRDAVDERFEELRRRWPEFSGEYAPPWGLPSPADFAFLEEHYGARYPKSFVRFQTHFAAVFPQPDNSHLWANQGLEPYLSIEYAITFARERGVPEKLVPFSHDEGNFTCFDMSLLSADGESPVEFWDHESKVVTRKAQGFIEWLDMMYKLLRSQG